MRLLLTPGQAAEIRSAPALLAGIRAKGALAARAYALLHGRGYVTPQDVKSIGLDVLRHRIIVSYEAEAEELTSDAIVQKIFAGLPVP